MQVLEVKLLNPQAKQLLLDLESLKLISVIKKDDSKVMNLLEKLSKEAKSAPTLEEITEEVEIVRAERYAKRMAQNNN